MAWIAKYPYCHDLPTMPTPNIGKVLVTGATGYIGGRLVPELITRGYQVRIMTRTYSPENEEIWPDAEVVVADALEYKSLVKALDGVHTAYYMIHSLLLGHEKFVETDIQAAKNFRRAAEDNNIKRIIYLGGLGDTQAKLSPHLISRIKVAEELKNGIVSATVLRAAIIIGSGSAPYEIITNLVKNTPVLFIPPWLKTNCQPISIRDVIKYLVGVLETEETSGRSFDIGGPDILTYEKILKDLAKLLGKKRLFLPSFISNIGFYAYCGSFLTPVPVEIIRSLFEGAKDEVICLNNDIKKIIPMELVSYKHALLRAMTREEQDEIHTRWSGSYPPAHELSIKLDELEKGPIYTTTYSLLTDKEASALFNSICRVGGKAGWFNSNFLWKMRGLIDRILLGVGTARGRRSAKSLRINDVIDFWRVEKLKQNRNLLLRAEMKLPGKAWLEFSIDQVANKSRLTVTAYYQTETFLGKVYWYLFLPFHHFIFSDLIKQIEKKS